MVVVKGTIFRREYSSISLEFIHLHYNLNLGYDHILIWWVVLELQM
jgi:hypothetical protein